MNYLLDICVLSEVTRRRPAELVVGWLEEQDESALYLSVVTIGEILKGIARLHAGPKKRRLQTWLEQDLAERFAGRVLEVDTETAARWGIVSGEAELKGTRIPVLDGLIAATAYTKGMTLVTRDTDHMRATGVSLLDPWMV